MNKTSSTLFKEGLIYGEKNGFEEIKKAPD